MRLYLDDDSASPLLAKLHPEGKVMKTLHFRQRTGANGHLRLDIPVGKADAECEVVVVVEPAAAPAEWLPGFWEHLSKGWQGEPLTRPPQGEYETRAPLR